MIGTLAVAACGLACGVGTLVLILDSPGGSLAGSSTPGAVALVGTGWLAIAVGLGAWRRRRGNRFGVLLVAAGFAWFVAEWNNPGASSPAVFTIGLVVGAACPPLATHAAVSYPSGRLGSANENVVVATAYIGSLFVLGLGPALVFEPAEQGCRQCATNLIAVGNDPALVASLNRAGVRLGLAWALALGALAMWRLVRTTPAARRVTAPVLVPAIVYLGALAATYGHALDRGFLSNDALDRRLWLVQAGALALLVLGVIVGWVNVRRARAAVADMVVQLAAAPPPGGLRAALARTLGDPQLAIAYPLPDGRHVDADGAAIAPATAQGRATTALLHGGETVAYVFHRDDLLGDPRLVEEAASAARLAFANERLQAEARAEFTELRTSRARLVASSDAERRRLERDLHDGAQQRLVGLTLAMRIMRTQLERDGRSALAEQIAAANAELRRAVDELRELASGIHPAVLTDYGLAPAIEALAERGKTTVRLSGATDERFSSAAENALYLIVAEAARLGPVNVTMCRRDTTLVFEVDAAGEPPRLVDLEDRIGALEGTMAIKPTLHGVRIRAEIPCG